MNRLKFLREKNNLTQKELAKKLFMSDSNYAKYENGKLELTKEQANILAKFYNCSISYLLDDSTEDILITKQEYELLLKVRNMINKLEINVINSSKGDKK